MIARIVLLASLLLACPTFAQDASARRARAARPPAWTPPATLALASASGRYDVALGFVASGEFELVTDARLFSIEVSEVAEGRRRPRRHTCRLPGRIGPREVLPSRPMHDGEAWGIRLDLRTLCWGRPLAALEAGGAVTVRYAAGRRGIVARGPGGETVRELSAASTFALAPRPDEPAAVTLAPVDAARPGFPLRVAVYGPAASVRRVWIRPDQFSFRVRDPAGDEWLCALPRAGGTAIPDLFSRFSARRPIRFTLDAAQFCPRDVFRQAGIYEVTPIVDLDEDGAAWRLDAVVGRLEGRAAAVRLRGGEGVPFVTLSDDEAWRLLR